MKASSASSKAPQPTFLRRYLGAALTLLAVAITGVAAMRWASLLGNAPQAIAQSSDTRAWALLGRALQSNNHLVFSAHVETVVFVGARGLQSEARLTSAPDHLAIAYLSGPLKGQHSGFSDRVFWRQNASGQLLPYAQTFAAPKKISERRFERMRANYRAQLRAPGEIAGRPVEVIELRPARPLRGTTGPARRVFVDDATGLILRTEAFNSRLQPVSHSTFSRLDLQPQIVANDFHEAAEITSAAEGNFWRGEELGDDARAVELQTGIEPPQSATIPRGWTRDGFGIHRYDGPDEMRPIAAFTRYTDGLNVLTLFAMRNTTELQELSSKSEFYHCSFGPGTLISRTDGAGTLLAIGDLPPEILRRVLNNAHFEQVALASPSTTPVATPPVSLLAR